MRSKTHITLGALPPPGLEWQIGCTAGEILRIGGLAKELGLTSQEVFDVVKAARNKALDELTPFEKRLLDGDVKRKECK